MTGIEQIAKERRRQIKDEHWSLAHDKEEHTHFELTDAAIAYAIAAQEANGFPQDIRPSAWWPESWDFKPADSIKCLVKAGALIAAEIDRLTEDSREGK